MTRRPPGGLPSLLLALCLLLVLAGHPGEAFAAGSDAPGGGGGEASSVMEHLRLKVPAGTRQAWLQAERDTWEPWLRRQEGFLGRELLWDPTREEGVLLIRWRSRRQWRAIPEQEIASVQRRFEAAARRALGTEPGSGGATETANPFPLVFSGELEEP